MIPAEFITFNDDGTAWLVMEACGEDGGCAVFPGCFCPFDIPGIVLPIFDRCPDYEPGDHICATHTTDWWIWHRSDNDDWTELQIQLPPAAAPDMWAVQLKVAP